MSIVRVSNACKKFQTSEGPIVVLKNFSMTVSRGAIYSLMGASGCGKTTIISCLVGIIELDTGEIEIFGDAPRENNLRIGYMPQEAALAKNLTIREMIWFYGSIYGLPQQMIHKKVKFLCDLLELPDESKLVRNCSGGLQRRVSIAISLLHEPELLILDEPTVGLDPILRAKIWNYLVELTQMQNVTVLLSTHYTEEAKQSTHVALMRNGILIAEDQPQRILNKVGASYLDDAFIELSHTQDRNEKLNTLSLKSHGALSEVFSETAGRVEGNCKQINFKILAALLTKNFLQNSRRIENLFITLFVPILVCICLDYSVGGKLKGLTLGIVNAEVDLIELCWSPENYSMRAHGDCTFEKISCHFIREFDEEMFDQVFYDSHEDALKDVLRGKIDGFIEFTPKFFDSFRSFNVTPSGRLREEELIQVFLEQTDIQKTSFIKLKVIENYLRFMEKLSEGCGKIDKVSGLINIRGIFGELDFDFRHSLIPSVLLGFIFCFASFISSTSIVSEKVGGTWNRALVTGVKPIHFLISHVIEGLAFMSIVHIEISIYLLCFMMPSLCLRAMAFASGILFLGGTAGLLFGLCCSIVMRSSFASFMVSQFTVYPPVFLSGMVWPVEGMPPIIQLIAYCVPFTLPIKALRKLFIKDIITPVTLRPVVLGYATLIAWCFFLLFLCLWLLRDKSRRQSKSKGSRLSL